MIKPFASAAKLVLWCALVVCACIILLPSAPAQVGMSGESGANQPGGELFAKPLDVKSKEAQFAVMHPGTGMGMWKGSSRIYGRAFGNGQNPVAAAEAFRRNVMPELGIPADDLKPYANFLPEDHATGHTVPVMYNPATGQYKFTAVYYTQERGGLEVYGSRMVLLTRNERNNPLVLAAMHLRDLGNFQVNAIQGNGNTGAAFANARTVVGDENFEVATATRRVIWAGVEDMIVPPAVALEFSAHGGDVAKGTYQAFRFLTDINTGAILHMEPLVHDIDVTGNISGMATVGHSADICGGGIAPTPLPYAKAAIGATSVFADANGNFTIPNAGTDPVTVTANLTGRYFRVQNSTTGGGNSVLTQNISPPGPADFMFNEPNNPDAAGQYKRAEVNAYLHSNVVRDYILQYNPAYPSVATETNFPVNVNINLTCNAFYSSLEQSINFYVSGNGCSNTANSTVVHHEYGHRLVNAAGSGQGAYGEGMSDCIAVIVTDQPCLGDGFNQPCGAPGGCLRRADNDCQYSASTCTTNCGGPNHPCGRLISGCVWSTRNYLAATNPGDYREILSGLVVNSILLHTGSSITPQITVDFLTLDDNDSNILNGTPHYNQINNGFTDHGMPGPALEVGVIVSPAGAGSHFTSSGLMGGPFTPPSKTYSLFNIEDTPQEYQVQANQPWVSISNASGIIQPQQTVQVEVSLNAAATSLGNGLYVAQVSFANLTSGLGDTTRNVNLEIGRITYSAADTPVPVPDNTPGVFSFITIPDAYCVGDVDVCLNLSHTFIGDLIVELKSPQGTVVRLHNRTGGSADNIVKCYSDGTITPDGPGTLAAFNGQIVTGTWELKVSDLANGDFGTLNSWDLRIVPLGAVCPPVASNVNVPVPVITVTPITLSGASSTGSPLSYIIASLPANASLYDPQGGAITTVPHMLSNGGNVVDFQPHQGASGAQSFTYRVNDGQDSNLATVIANVVRPVANTVAVSVPTLITSNIVLSGVPSGATPAHYVITSLPTHGVLFDPSRGTIASLPYVLLNQGNVVRYRPDADFAGLDSFTYQLAQGNESSTNANVNVTVGGPQLVHSFNFDTDPGWSMDAGWQFGAPCGCGVSGRLDPSAAFTGVNVYGYAAGSYTNNLTPARYLTTGAMNCANLSNVQVKFRRWLGVEQSAFDHARLYASSNGTTWVEIWRNPSGTGASINEQAWSAQSYDISAVADGQATVYLRWQMGTTDGSVTYQGWNIDDVEIWGIRPPCPMDITGDQTVGVPDLLAVISQWGACPNGCSADVVPFGGDGAVGVPDLLGIISGWGACP